MAQEIMETKQEVTNKLVIGALLILFSLILGKLVLVPLFMFPGNKTWAVWMFWTYLFSWVPLVIGLIIAGVEGYKLAMHKYRTIKKRSIYHSKKTVRRVSQGSRKAATKIGSSSRRTAQKMGEKSKRTARRMGRESKKTARKIRDRIKK